MSVHAENAELNGILSTNKRVQSVTAGSKERKLKAKLARECMPCGEEEEDPVTGFVQWTTTDNEKYFPAGHTVHLLPPAFYEPSFSSNTGYFLSKLECKIDGLLKFPETNSEKVISEIQTFWEKEEKYKAHNLSYKRGIILWGPPGSGKSCCIKLVLKDVLDRGGVAIKFNSPHLFLECVRIFRRIQPATPLVVLMEDIDSILDEYGETDVLNILDGVENLSKVVYLATTNYPELLGGRIINRPSRFDRRFKMPHPSKASRQLYLQHLLDKAEVDTEVNLDLWVKDTHGMSIAHLKELFVAVCILGDPYAEVIALLRSMTEEKLHSESDKIDNFGFQPYRESND